MIPKNCTFCGLCCTLRVRLSFRDISLIEKTGKKKEEFVVADNDGKLLLKKENGHCIFFSSKRGIGMCGIYEERPGNCRAFPGKDLCDLAENPIYAHLSNNEDNESARALIKKAPTGATAEDSIRKAQLEAREVLGSRRK